MLYFALYFYNVTLY